MQLSPGDRIELSDLGRQKSPRTRVRTGIVLLIAGKRLSKNAVLIRFDGRSTPCRLHNSYLKKADAV